MVLPAYIKEAIKLLEDNHYEVVVVGGAVRDYLLNIMPNDYDLSTNAHPEEIKEVFSGYKLFDYGIKHGTISVLINDKLVEVTTYRTESGYDDYRRPNEVKFVKSLKYDLSRRDFTINAICFNKDYIDYHNGIKDLYNQVIRVIGSGERFKEDPLRILRALRFASTLSFKIEKETKKAMLDNFYLIENISNERIKEEVKRFLLGNNFWEILLEYKDYLEEFVFKFPIEKNILDVFKFAPNDFEIKTAILLFNKQETVYQEFLKRLRYSNKEIKVIDTILKFKSYDFKLDERNILLLLKDIEYNTLGKLISVLITIYYLNIERREFYEELETLYINAREKLITLAELNINGTDLINLGFKPGKRIKQTLDNLLDKVLFSKLINDKAILLKEAEKYLKSVNDSK